MYNLIFFAAAFASCGQKMDTKDIRLIWDHDRPIGISISKSLIKELNEDQVAQQIKIHLAEDKDTTAILGSYKTGDQEIIFEPLIPFSRGLHYQIFYKSISIGRIEIPIANASEASELKKIYPTLDTLPANLLKVYLEFSKPMREGVSETHIFIIENGKDTVPGVFLNLNPELWNEDRTVLTLWVDPGRIKRDLIPNLALGNPLKEETNYKLFVSKNWPNAKGLTLKSNYIKNFYVFQRDSLSPEIKKWKIHAPKANSSEPLIINLNEALDHFLLLETIQLLNVKNEVIPAKLIISDKDRQLMFVPDTRWVPGGYKVKVEARLEDLAGNNLNRPFDRDLTHKNRLDAHNIQYVPLRIK